ncbi:aspartate-semialdehyde dehydrogenase [Bacillus sp. FJAT-27264]|uniref:aspartate-semialdehyde dehydrogenase n=1 Tax=Paenibacillus sp. (strain DSM 101736 / FJAT-27264) TaxID=1850362 RepID=UPI000807BC38|nr:aspartate-semialdehyde dehydrogenase [Bacillus sp. FJAT-27264]OBZ14476.1 aspartate-semialdehyde dehydrogenase [Bacillus sp. FJAT-27264]
MTTKLRAGIVGGTGMVGQRFIALLENHPWFEVTAISASSRSAGKTFEESIAGRWKLETALPDSVKNIMVQDASQVEEFAKDVDLIFCAVDMKKEEIKKLEEDYARTGTPVISNNSAHRWTPDVPMVIPELNPDHIKVIEQQRKRLGTATGFIAVKPNCSIQSYVPALHALAAFEPEKVVVSTYQAISGAGKTFADWPEMIDNVIPYIGGEEEKSEQEPLRIWGELTDEGIVKASTPVVTSQCIRVPVADGHMASVFVSFKKTPSKEEILELWKNFKGRPQELELPSAPKQFITYFEEENRPQTKLDRDIENGMGVSTGRLREDSLHDFKFVGLSHNTLRGAAGGAVLIAELLKAEGYIQPKA